MQSDAYLLAQMDWLTLVLVAIIAFSTVLFHTFAAFVGALLLSVCLAPLIGVKGVVPVRALAMIIPKPPFPSESDSGTVKAVRRYGAQHHMNKKRHICFRCHHNDLSSYTN